MGPLDLTGQRFGRLVAVELVANKPRRWLVRCDCGRENRVHQLSLRSGKSQSCGCLQRERSTRHGYNRKGATTPTYRSWQAMKSRCLNPRNTNWPEYGGRGIKVCSAWLDFAVFLADMGERPAGTTLDRRDNDGHYEPGNCRWATATQQQANTRKTHPIELDGEVVSLIEASRRLGVSRPVIRMRITEHGDPRRRHSTERTAA